MFLRETGCQCFYFLKKINTLANSCQNKVRARFARNIKKVNEEEGGERLLKNGEGKEGRGVDYKRLFSGVGRGGEDTGHKRAGMTLTQTHLRFPERNKDREAGRIQSL